MTDLPVKLKWLGLGLAVGFLAAFLLGDNLVKVVAYFQPKHETRVLVLEKKTTIDNTRKDLNIEEEVTQYPDGRIVTRRRTIDKTVIDSKTSTDSKSDTHAVTTPVFPPAPFWNIVYEYALPQDRHYVGGGINAGPLSLWISHRVYPVAGMELDGRAGVMLRF